MFISTEFEMDLDIVLTNQPYLQYVHLSWAITHRD